MSGKRGQVKAYFTYYDGCVDAIVEDDRGRWVYCKGLENESGMKPHALCEALAEEIEEAVGADVKYTISNIGDGSTKRDMNVLMRHDYEMAFLERDDPYGYAERCQEELDELIADAEERTKAFPDDISELDTLIGYLLESRFVWEECSRRLRDMAKSTDDESEVSSLARKINRCEERSKEYNGRYMMSISRKSNRSPLGQVGNSLQSTGKALRGAGNAMSSAGHSMTIGCTIPIVIAILVMILLMFIF